MSLYQTCEKNTMGHKFYIDRFKNRKSLPDPKKYQKVLKRSYTYVVQQSGSYKKT